ncbi:MAG: sigma-70 family RNA polymerase sigma factor [Bacteroidota bacterium]
MMISDETLMEQVRKGELRKATELFDRYNKPLYSFFVRLTLDRDLSNDLTQNVFLRMLKYRKTYQPGKPFKAWIYQMARNIHADHYRKNKVMFSDIRDVEQVSSPLAGFEDRIVQNEKEKLLYVSLFKMDTEQREILILTRFQQMKYEEVAAMLEISVANVKVKVHRAMHKLKETYMELEKI